MRTLVVLQNIVECTARYPWEPASSDEQLVELKDELKESLVSMILIRSFEDMRSLMILTKPLNIQIDTLGTPVLMNN